MASAHRSGLANDTAATLRKMDATDIAFAGAAEQARMLAAGSISAPALLDLYLDRIARLDRELRSYRIVLAASARREAAAAQERLDAGERLPLLGVPVAIKDKPDAVALEDFEPTVEFRNVTFGYDAARPILHDISFKVNPREVVALVGPTGSGKTSIIALAHRFYEVDQGAVLVGGIDVRDVTLDSLGRRIAMVLQEPFLFTGTIEENIRYNTLSATRQDIVAAAQAVSAHGFIMRLPDGYDTRLGQRGRNISVGQRQLISFARALVADPQILILDEATANIDSFTEQAVQKALKVLFAGRTCMVIAHRLGTIRDADRIIVLQQGRILEQGGHDQLMRAGGLYHHLYTSAHASFDDQVVAQTGDAEFATRT